MPSVLKCGLYIVLLCSKKKCSSLSLWPLLFDRLYCGCNYTEWTLDLLCGQDWSPNHIWIWCWDHGFQCGFSCNYTIAQWKAKTKTSNRQEKLPHIWVSDQKSCWEAVLSVLILYWKTNSPQQLCFVEFLRVVEAV